MWSDNSVFYQIYPLGFCGAPQQNDHVPVNRIGQVEEWIPHLLKMHVNAIYFSPVFESDTHGYDTADYTKIDTRLGTNQDFAHVCLKLHQNNIKVVLDGVFNHVGRSFGPFVDVLKNREASPYVGWFHIDFNGNSPYNDGLWYEGWEGHYELVKLNLQNPDVKNYLFDCVCSWIDQFDIDGLRLDVAYLLPEDFMRQLRGVVRSKKEDFFLLGEMLHGDYNRICNDQMLDSVTNYECYKGLYSSFNSYNFFEICYSLNRQFGPEQWTLYRGKHLYNFADNHDVTRLATILQKQQHIAGLYAMLFTMPGIPSIYYGSEWGIQGDKSAGDNALRPQVEKPEWNELTDTIAKLAAIHRESNALCWGDYRQIYLTNRQCVYLRSINEEKVYVCINCDENEAQVKLDTCLKGVELFEGRNIQVDSHLTLPPYGFAIIRQTQE